MNIQILLTFFSPSGYEARKNYAGADYIFYLPLDTKKNAEQFVDIVKPAVVFFVKYEFWFHYLNALKKTNAFVYIFSALFRENQIFFKWYGKWYCNILHVFKHIFVQNIDSDRLLKSVGVSNVTIMGDTRFDRVFEIVSTAKKLPLVERFKSGHLTFIAGSTWYKDEKLLAKYVNKLSSEYRIIIAPHEVSEKHIQQIIKLFKKPCIRFSQATEETVTKAEILIVDGIGYLSSLYKYGDIAYIGGGFGKGIHNLLEAATFGLPVVFGPNYHKFLEAKDLIRMNGAFSISNSFELKHEFDRLINDRVHLMQSGILAKKYVDANCGATNKIIQQVMADLF